MQDNKMLYKAVEQLIWNKVVEEFSILSLIVVSFLFVYHQLFIQITSNFDMHTFINSSVIYIINKGLSMIKLSSHSDVD